MHSFRSYLAVFWTFARNSLVRDMTFRANFLIEAVSSVCWATMNLLFYALVYGLMDGHANGEGSLIAGWGRHQFFVFIATTMLVNTVVEALFMPNVEELSELVRGGGLDFALLKPIDAQFLVSLQKVSWSSLAKLLLAGGLMAYSLPRIPDVRLTPTTVLLYLFYVGCGALLLYSLMIALASTSIWLGRNQSLYDFWFYITNFARYPMEIYEGTYGTPLRQAFTWLVPVMVVINVPAAILARPLLAETPERTLLAAYAIVAAIVALWASRQVFLRALQSYRSASS